VRIDEPGRAGDDRRGVLAVQRRARLMAAAELLTTTDATVATIAGQVGYSSESAFSRAFRAHLGTTPARFRRERTRAPRATKTG
jgi:AraC family transcriptional regulator, activator of mtrCDE